LNSCHLSCISCRVNRFRKMMDASADDAAGAAAAEGVMATADLTLDDVTKMSKVWHTVLSMLLDRGYHIPVEKLNLSLDAFKEQFVEDDESGRRTQVQEDKLSIVARKADDPTQSIMVFFCREMKMGVSTLEEYSDRVKKANCHSVIIVLYHSMTTQCHTKMREVELKNACRIETFTEAELVVDITKHNLVPKHVVLSDKEKQDLLQRYHVTVQQLPKITTTDPIARHYGLRLGEVVKIIRFSETAGQYVTYRYVI